ncbi:type II toxin-antitoxin system VapC family toxin [Candidatus Woesearchaeota archaeon]|nr:type II toxin-antitoxin system VapC family toxin [Candidatus Woesearchaeota archaeon]
MEEDQTYYLDSNVFIYAVVNTEKLGNKCRNLLKDIQVGKIIGITSCLTYDEIIWILRKICPDKITESSKNFLNLNIKFADVNKLVLHKTENILEKYSLKPRDSIHIATMQINNCNKIISEDSDFDKVEDIKRINILELEDEN